MRGLTGRARTWVAAGLLAAAVPAGATTLRRMGLEDLTRTNQMALMGRVVDATSRWNDEGTFILTDVRFEPDTVLKGNRSLEGQELTVTLMGGTVGELTTLIVAGAELVPGGEYLLFLSPSDLPGAEGVLSVRDHCQGVFELVRGAGGVQAVSQARTHPLLSDDLGLSEPPGGRDGLPLSFMLDEMRRFTAAERK